LSLAAQKTREGPWEPAHSGKESAGSEGERRRFIFGENESTGRDRKVQKKEIENRGLRAELSRLLRKKERVYGWTRARGGKRPAVDVLGAQNGEDSLHSKPGDVDGS